MAIRILNLMFISHLLCDFIFQNEKIINYRFSKNLYNEIKGNFFHCTVHLFFMIFILFLFKKIDMIREVYYIIPFEICVIHFGIDQIKSIIIKLKSSMENSIILFLSDQTIHFVCIFVIVGYYYGGIVGNINRYPYNINIFDRILILINIFFICTFEVGIFIKKFIAHINLNKYRNLIDNNFVILNKDEEKRGIDNGGFIIGILERMFIILVISFREPLMIGFVLTAKSIARFKKLDDESFAEYFLIGTFISFIIAIIGGVLINTLKIF
ncbi:MAG: DUF3307 domain-containing protein [Clostridium sp.]|nr:DUF3307 domain-containing protein [Clostridium sp.]